MQPTSILFTPDGTQLLVATANSKIISLDYENGLSRKGVINLSSDDQRKTCHANFITVSDDGQFLAVMDSSCAVQLFNWQWQEQN